MTLTPILTAPIEIQIHIFFVLCAVVLGPPALLRRSRDWVHRAFGVGWVMAMAGTAISSFFIGNIGVIAHFSPIHLLSLLVLWTLFSALRSAVQGQWRRHGQMFRALYVQAIGIAGLFTFLPGRRMSQVVFPNAPIAGFSVLATLAVLAYIVSRPGPRRIFWAAAARIRT